MTSQALEQPIELQVTHVGFDLGQVLVGDLDGGQVDGLLHLELVTALVGAKGRNPLADRHQVAGPEQRVATDVLEGIFLFTRVDVDQAGASQEGLERIAAQPAGQHHAIRS